MKSNLHEVKEVVMVLKTVGIAGTLESSDAMITVEPANEGGIVIDVSSSVKRQFGRQITETVLNTIKELGVENASVKVVDKGALNYALIARTKAAVYTMENMIAPITAPLPTWLSFRTANLNLRS